MASCLFENFLEDEDVYRLLIPDRRPGPISHSVEQGLPQFVGEK